MRTVMQGEKVIRFTGDGQGAGGLERGKMAPGWGIRKGFQKWWPVHRALKLSVHLLWQSAQAFQGEELISFHGTVLW